MKNEPVNMTHLKYTEVEKAEVFLDLEMMDVSIQEQHHAMHVLTFILFIKQISYKNQWVHRSLIDRAIFHLIHLREYIHDPEMGDLVTDLSSSLMLASEHPVEALRFFEDEADKFNMDGWFSHNEQKIMTLAEYYGKTAVFREPAKVA
ncbi:MAG: hypothetical protein H6757_04585 [Candidatus Omnitrophica bacterium]|nr:hypothetical protein [Candidatus Omnitrophota bacterium]